MGKLLTIQILGFNGRQHLERAVGALRSIPAEDVSIRYIDNGSTDGSVEFMRQALPNADLVQASVNAGYAGGHNLGFSLCTTPFVLVHDQDAVIDWQGVTKLLKAFDDPRVGAVQGKLYRATSDTSQRIFDTAGIVQTLSLNAVDRGAGEEDRGQFDQGATVLAAQGACALYRMEALLATAQTLWDREIPDIFDQDFFMYKEDVDLGWRLSNAGWKVLYQPVVAGRHARTLGKQGRGGWGMNPGVVYQRLKSPRTRHSLRNYCYMIAKNASAGQMVIHSPFILARLGVFFLLSLVYPPLLSVWKETAQGLPRMLAKRP